MSDLKYFRVPLTLKVVASSLKEAEEYVIKQKRHIISDNSSDMPRIDWMYCEDADEWDS